MPVIVVCAGGLAIALALLWVSARAAITIAVAEVRNGTLKVTRGGLAPRVLGDLRDVVARPRIARATVRIVRSRDRARIEVRGKVSAQQLQRLRNVVGNVPIPQLARLPRP